MKMKNFDRTDRSPIFMNTKAKNAINLATRQIYFIIETKCLDVGKDFDDIGSDMYVLWCECCVEYKDKTEEYVVGAFEKRAEWARKNLIREYFNQLDGQKDITGPEPFEPDFYQFMELYRNGNTIDGLAEHYGVSRETIKRYMSRNFVTKQPIDPQLYLDCHKKLHGRDISYWNIRSELITRFEVD